MEKKRVTAIDVHLEVPDLVHGFREKRRTKLEAMAAWEVRDEKICSAVAGST